MRISIAMTIAMTVTPVLEMGGRIDLFKAKGHSGTQRIVSRR